MTIVYWVIAYVCVGVVNGWIRTFSYYNREFSRMNEDEMLMVIFDVIFWPVTLPFLIVNVLSNTTFRLRDYLDEKKKSKNLQREFKVREQHVALQERELAIQRLEKELGMPLTSVQKKEIGK